MSQKIFEPSRKNIVIAIVAAVLVFLAGYSIIQTNATGFFAFFDAGNSQASGNAKVINDSSASSGKAIQFTAATTPPPTGGGTSTSDCAAFPAFPDENCTGYQHTGVTLHACASPLTAANYDSCLFTGEVSVSAPNISVTRSKINGTVNYRYADGGSLRGLKLTDVEIDSSSSLGGASIGNNDYTCTRCHVHGGTRGANLGYNVVIRDSYLHGWTSNTGDHITGVGSNGGANNVVDHNNISCDILNDPTTNFACSAGLSVYGDDAPGNNNWTITHNLINSGSSYCMTIGGPPAKQYPFTNMTITDNKFGNFGAKAFGKPDSFCSEDGPTNIVGWTTATNVWKNNVDWNGNQVSY